MSEQTFIAYCKNGDLEGVKSTYSEHYNINLGIAFSHIEGHRDITQWLMTNDKTMKGTITNLKVLIENEDYDGMVKDLQDSGCDVYENLDKMFLWYCSENCMPYVRMYLHIGVDPQVNNNEAIISACSSGFTKLAQYLFSVGADINAQNNNAFILACKYNHLETASWINSITDVKNVKSAVIQASSEGNLGMVIWLHSLGFDINAFNDTAFVIACRNNHVNVVRWLLDFISEKSVKLGCAASCRSASLDVVDFLLNNTKPRSVYVAACATKNKTTICHLIPKTENGLKFIKEGLEVLEEQELLDWIKQKYN